MLIIKYFIYNKGQVWLISCSKCCSYWSKEITPYRCTEDQFSLFYKSKTTIFCKYLLQLVISNFMRKKGSESSLCLSEILHLLHRLCHLFCYYYYNEDDYCIGLIYFAVFYGVLYQTTLFHVLYQTTCYIKYMNSRVTDEETDMAHKHG